MNKFNSISRVMIVCVVLLLGFNVLNVCSASVSQSQKSKEETAFKGGKAIYFYNQGNNYKDKGDIEQAIISWSKAIEVKPDFALAYYNRGNALGRRGKLDESISDFTKVISTATDQKLKVLAYYNRAVGYGKQEKVDEAIADYTKVIEMDPKYAPAYKNRAVVYFFKKDYDSSWKDVHKSEELGLKMNSDFLQDLKSDSGRTG